MTDDERRLLELLAASDLDGCTDALLLAHGFGFDLVACLVLERLATATAERTFADGNPVEVTRVKITAGGRAALAAPYADALANNPPLQGGAADRPGLCDRRGAEAVGRSFGPRMICDGRRLDRPGASCWRRHLTTKEDIMTRIISTFFCAALAALSANGASAKAFGLPNPLRVHVHPNPPPKHRTIVTSGFHQGMIAPIDHPKRKHN